MQCDSPHYCDICLNNVAAKFAAGGFSICKRCITDVIKYGELVNSGDWNIFTIRSIIDEHRYQIVEFNYEYEITKGMYSLDKIPKPPQKINVDSIMSESEKEVREKEGFFGGIYRSLFDKSSRIAEVEPIFDRRLSESKLRFDKDMKDSIDRVVKFKNDRNNFIAHRDQYIAAQMQDWMDSIVYDKISASDLLYKIPVSSKKTNGRMVIGAAWVAKLIRAYHYNIITGEAGAVPRLPNDEREKLNIKILNRDENKCYLCDETYKNRGLEVHHVIDLKYGGTHDHANLVTLCVLCHNKQHSHTTSNVGNVRKGRRGGVFVAVDIETTGFSNSDEIIEIAAILFENSYVRGKFNELVYTERLIPSRVSKLTGITNEMLIGKPLMSDVFPRLMDFISCFDIVVHNKSFDERFLKRYAHEYGFVMSNNFIDTLEISREKLPNLSSHKLGDVAFYLGMDGVNFHRAYDDAMTTGTIYIKLLNTRKQQKKLPSKKAVEKPVKKKTSPAMPAWYEVDIEKAATATLKRMHAKYKDDPLYQELMWCDVEGELDLRREAEEEKK